MMTVQAPHWLVSHPTCAPVRFSCSRRKWTRSVRGSTSPADLAVDGDRDLAPCSLPGRLGRHQRRTGRTDRPCLALTAVLVPGAAPMRAVWVSTISEVAPGGSGEGASRAKGHSVSRCSAPGTTRIAMSRSNGCHPSRLTSSMSEKYFVDTNILMPAHDKATGATHERAKAIVEELWRDRTGVARHRCSGSSR